MMLMGSAYDAALHVEYAVPEVYLRFIAATLLPVDVEEGQYLNHGHKRT